jgi:alpha-beta hydrolase superfamily lysophospholipase
MALSGCEILVAEGLDTHSRTAAVYPKTLDQRTLTLESGGRQLASSFVRAPNHVGPLLLIFHGDGETIGDWVAAQKFLASRGFDSFVFDYSGFGVSAGLPTIDHLRQDALAAFAEATTLANERDESVYIVAHSLGTNVVIDAAPYFSKRPAGYTLWGAATSMRAFVVRSGTLPESLIFLIPDRWDNLRDARAISPPAMVIHGSEDQVASAAEGQAIAAKAGAAYVSVPGADHEALHADPKGGAWKPILRHARSAAGAARPRSAACPRGCPTTGASLP